jgi:hypothetical protein
MGRFGSRACLRILFLTTVALILGSAVSGQSVSADDRPRLLFDAEIGSQAALGYELPSISVGPSLEIPIANRFEVQASGAFSPDKKQITHDGHLARVSGTAIVFANRRVGFSAGAEDSWLWTSQFNKTALYPSTGIVLRNDYFGPGRFYVAYVFPTGCVAATTSNPCQIQSNRLQGITVRQDTRWMSHTRLRFESGAYHFCDQGNPNEPEISRHCHWGVTGMVTLRFELKLGAAPRSKRAEATVFDNF